MPKKQEVDIIIEDIFQTPDFINLSNEVKLLKEQLKDVNFLLGGNHNHKGLLMLSILSF
jgi:hypothetical protein